MRRHTALALAAGLGLLPLLALRADDKPDKKAEAQPAARAAKVEVPYRLTDANHLMVRVKINGKGPFNFIVDTGAPAIFLHSDVAKRAKLELHKKDDKKEEKKDGDKKDKDAEKKDWVVFDSFEVEGGLKVEKARGRVEDLVQLEGMNKLGLAGVEVHGVIGYEVLARYRIEYDLTRDRLVFEPLKFDPPPLVPVGGKAGSDIQSMGPLVKMMAAFLGIKPNFDVVPRGFTGIMYEAKDGKVTIKAVLPGSPAEKAGLKVGDVITSVKTVAIDSEKDLAKALAKAGVGTKWRFYITRGEKEEEIVVELGKGL